jgi:4-amino-4-deoxy-L-arabinose transferase-like glycosyltransferase
MILLLALFLRFYNNNNFPPSLNWDEVSHGYNAYSVLKTGMDEWGKKFPIIDFRAYGDYPLTLNLYLTIPFIRFLGLNQFSIRLPHMILGVLTVVSSYFLVLGIFKKKNYALLTSLLVAIDPWLLFPSRGVFQSNLSVFLLITSMALFFNREKKKFLLPLSLFTLLLTLFSYHSTRIFSPLLLISILSIYRDDLISFLKVKKAYSTLILGIISVFFISLALIFINPESRARSQWVFLIDQGAINKINEQRALSTLPQELKRFVYNKPLYVLKGFSDNYIKYFSPKFLFFKGGTQYQFSNPKFGLLLYPNLIFFYIGFIWVFYKALIKKERNYLFILVWILIAPIAASITKESYAVLRSTTMLPIPEILSVLGFYFIFDLIKKKKIIGKIFFGTYVLSLLFCLFIYFKDTMTNYIYNYSWSWQYGYEETIEFTKNNYFWYDKIIITKKYGEPHEFLLFFWPWQPKEYIFDKNLIRFGQSGWYWVDSFDKFYFVNDWEIPTKENEDFKLESGTIVNCGLQEIRCLLITSPNNYPKGWKKLKTIKFLDGKSAFEIYENK